MYSYSDTIKYLDTSATLKLVNLKSEKLEQNVTLIFFKTFCLLLLLLLLCLSSINVWLDKTEYFIHMCGPIFKNELHTELHLELRGKTLCPAIDRL